MHLRSRCGGSSPTWLNERECPAMSTDESGGDLFTTLSHAFVSDERATHGTMMGFPCLRRDGVFFASLDPTTEALVVKLPADRVATLIDSGPAEPFAPNGRRFRESGCRAPGCQDHLGRASRGGVVVRRQVIVRHGEAARVPGRHSERSRNGHQQTAIPRGRDASPAPRCSSSRSGSESGRPTCSGGGTRASRSGSRRAPGAHRVLSTRHSTP